MSTATASESEATPDLGQDQTEIEVNGARLLGDLSGALYWPARRCLIVADLHLEKGSSYAPGGQFLPPYDTAATLTALSKACQRYRPERVLCLGDSFHDQEAPERLPEPDADSIRTLTGAHDWIWLCGNHDPTPPSSWGGRVEIEMVDGPLQFRHEALTTPAAPGRGVAGEVSGHFHPKAVVRVRNKRLSARCFVTDGRRLILPAFGAYTGGLNVLDPAVAGLFGRGFQVHLLGRRQAFVFPKRALIA